jgi:diguanylate cyclase (GGDEF)-like protein
MTKTLQVPAYNMKLSTAVNTLIASNNSFDGEEIMRHQLFVYLTLINLISAIILISLIIIYRPDIFLSSELLIIIAISCITSLWLYKKNIALIHCSNILLTGQYITSVGICLGFLNAYGVPLYFYLAIPITAYFINGAKSGYSWTIITLIPAILFLVFKSDIAALDLGFKYISNEHAYAVESRIYISSMATVAICCYLYTYLYYRERKILIKQRQELLHIINYDELTGIYNCKKMAEVAGGIIDRDSDRTQKFAYSFIGMKNFKALNEEYGFDFGDEILKQLAYRLKKSLASNQQVARLNGTRFALVTRDCESLQKTQDIIAKQVAQAWDNLDINGVKVSIIEVIGTAIYPDDGDTLKAVTTKADREIINQL